VIEAIVSFGLIALGAAVWLLARVARAIYRHRAHERDRSLMARLFSAEPADLPAERDRARER